MKVKIDIISGFLGAGKTTLIKKLLKEKFSHEKLMIIENEFGEIGIDKSLLKDSNIEITEINSGCICCSLVGDFSKAIEKAIATYCPDRIIIEPSGVGKLSDILKVCNSDKLKNLLKINMVITVVDVLNYDLYLNNFGEFFQNQIKNAKTILLSRIEKSDSATVANIITSLGKLNPKGTIITTPINELSSDVIVSVAEEPSSLEGQLKTLGSLSIKNNIRAEISKKPNNHSANEVFQCWSIETPKIYLERKLREILNNLDNRKDLGMILRGKGILQVERGRWIEFHYTPGHVEIKSTTPDYTGRLCIIGEGLNKSRITDLFTLYTLKEV